MFRGRAFVFLFFLLLSGLLIFRSEYFFHPSSPSLEDEFMGNHARASGIFTYVCRIRRGCSPLGALFGEDRLQEDQFHLPCPIEPSQFRNPFCPEFLPALPVRVGAWFCPRIVYSFRHPVDNRVLRGKELGKAIAIHDTGASMAIFATPLVALGLPSVLSLAGDIRRLRVRLFLHVCWSLCS